MIASRLAPGPRAAASGALLIAALLLGMTYALGAALNRLAVLPDAAYGLLVFNSMHRGAPWNHVTEADEENISVDRTYFYAVWSPGQYVVPGVLIDAGLSVGRSVAMVSIAASVGGLVLWWWLFRGLGHDQLSAAGAIVVIAVSRSFNHSFLSYVGSDVLAFAVFPLLVGILWRQRTSRWLAVYSATAILIGFAAKNSLPIYLGSWLVAQSAVSLRARGMSTSSVVAAGLPLATAAATMGAIHVGYNARGWTPVSYDPALSVNAHTYLLPWAMPLLAATSWDDVFSRVFGHPSAPIVAFDYKAAAPLIGALAAISIAGAARSIRHGNDAAKVAAIFGVTTVAAFTVLLATGSGASLELSRHYRLIGYVGLPWLVLLTQSSSRVWAVAVVVALAVPGVYGLGSFASNWRRHYERRASYSDAVQVLHPQMTARAVSALTTLDRELPAATLVVTSSADVALEFSRARLLPTSAVSDSVDRIRRNRRYGTVDNLVVIAELPAMPDDKRETWLDTFTAYRTWESVDVDNHRFYVPTGQYVNSQWLRDRFGRLMTR